MTCSVHPQPVPRNTIKICLGSWEWKKMLSVFLYLQMRGGVNYVFTWDAPGWRRERTNCCRWVGIERNKQGWDRIQSPTGIWAPGLLKQKKGDHQETIRTSRRDCFTDLQCVPVLLRCHWVSPGNKNRAPFIGYI